MATLIVIEGLTADDKVPGAYGETKFGQGKVSIGSFEVKCLLIGYKVSGGSATDDTDIDPIPGQAEADALYGARSVLAGMARAAFAAVGEGGVSLYGAPTAEDGAAVAATATITITGTWTTAGSFLLYAGGVAYTVAVAATDTIQNVADRIAALFSADSYLPFTAAVGAGPGYVVTLTAANGGEHMNQYYIASDDASRPSGMTVALAGGTPVSGGLVPFGDTPGSGAPTLTTLLALMTSEQYDYIVTAFNDATSLAALEAHVDAQALATVGRLEHMIAATNDVLATATSRAQTTLNAYRACMLWDEYQEALPCYWAAEFGAIRASREGTNPWQNYIGRAMLAAKPKRYGPNKATHAELKSALNVGLSPLQTYGGDVQIVRAIVTHCLDGTAPDYRCYDLPDAKVPDRVRQEIVALWGEHAAGNPAVQDNPAEGEDVPSGVTYPILWNSVLTAALYVFQDTNLWIQEVADNLPTSAYDDDSDRIVSAVPLVVRKINAQLGFSVRQIAA